MSDLARGVLLGIPLSLVLWAGIAFGLWLVLA